jgi:hypothetical protein
MVIYHFIEERETKRCEVSKGSAKPVSQTAPENKEKLLTCT